MAGAAPRHRWDNPVTVGFTLRSGISDPESAWSLLTDTDWMGRIADTRSVRDVGMQSGVQGYALTVGHFNESFRRSTRFTETDISWVVGRHFRHERTFDGVLQRSLYEMVFEREGGGVRATGRVEVQLSGRLAARVAKRRMKALEAIWAKVMEELPVPGGPPPRSLRRQIAPAVSAALERWSRGVGPNEVTQAFIQFVAHARPMELVELRPFQLAKRWELPRDEVLHAFLEGVVDGTFELAWVVRCPLCCAATQVSDDLEDLDPHGRCEGCRTDFEADPDETVEAVFTPHPNLRVKPMDRFCTRNPAAAPDVHCVQVLAPGAMRQVVVPLPEGKWRLSAGPASEPVVFRSSPTGQKIAVEWEPGATWLDRHVRAGDVTLILHNPGDQYERLLITDADVGQDRVTVSKLASFPTFRRHFGHVGIAGDVRLRARHVALLFTDLAGSVAFYRSVGDGEAFSFFQSHVGVLRPVLDEYGGAIVKSTGDGLLCAFDDTDMAVGCAIKMMERYNRWCAEREGESPAMRIGIHAGPTLIVRTAWAPLDYYGMTVNLAARAGALGEPGEIVWTEAVQDARGVAHRVDRMGLTPWMRSLTVKGMVDEMTFYGVKL
jgi:class 3 adenylate cyclase